MAISTLKGSSFSVFALSSAVAMLCALPSHAEGTATPAWGVQIETPKPTSKPPRKDRTNNVANPADTPPPVMPPASRLLGDPSAAEPVSPGSAPNPAQGYCRNIETAAIDARAAFQAAEIASLETGLQRRIALLEEKKNEYREWLTRRDEFIRKAEDSLVAMYAKVKPDAAAAQLSALDRETAAAILMKLGTRVSSAILDEMQPDKAAGLVAILVDAAKKPDPSPPPGSAAGGDPDAPRDGAPPQGDKKL